MAKIKELLDAEIIKPDFEKMNCGELVDYIISKHHQYALSAISQIRAILEQMVLMDSVNIELKLIKEYFGFLANEFSLHMKKEELVLFPNINKLVLAEANGTPYDRAGFGLIKSPASVMMTEHKTIDIMEGNLIKRCNNINASPHLSDLFAELYLKLNVFDEDLQQHAYLEDEVLVPKLMVLMQVFPN
jgi:regulator of cell morphogenesis and NO signaling